MKMSRHMDILSMCHSLLAGLQMLTLITLKDLLYTLYL